MYTPLDFMVAWLDGTLKGAPDGYCTVVVQSNLLGQGHTISFPRRLVKLPRSPGQLVLDQFGQLLRNPLTFPPGHIQSIHSRKETK